MRLLYRSDQSRQQCCGKLFDLQYFQLFLAGCNHYRQCCDRFSGRQTALCHHSIADSFLYLYVSSHKNKMHTAKAALKQRLNQYASNCAEQINKLSYIKRNTLYHEMSERLTRSFNHLLSASLHSVSVDYLFTNLNQVVIILAYLCIIGIGGYKVTTGALSIGLFSVINTYFNMMISSVSYFVGIAGSYQDTKISFQRIQKILQTPDEDKGDLLPESIHQVEVKDFSLQYGSHVILNHCNVTFRAGCIYGLRGPNGTGKTTLLNALVGLFSGEISGHIYYDGISINQLDMPALRRKKNFLHRADSGSIKYVCQRLFAFWH